MEPEDDTQAALELQTILTRYVDSEQGYLHAADLVENESLAAIFKEISGHRAATVPEIAALLEETGHEPDEGSSLEAAVHRWWMSGREMLSTNDLKDVLEECVRGESTLLKAIDIALASGNLDPRQLVVLEVAKKDVEKAISHFNAALRNGELG